MITSKDRAAVKKLIKTYEKVNSTNIDRLVDGFMDLALDYEYAKVNMKSEVYYFMKENGWL